MIPEESLHWEPVLRLVRDARHNESILYRLKSARPEEMTGILREYGIGPNELEKCRSDLMMFGDVAAFGKWFYVEAPPAEFE